MVVESDISPDNPSNMDIANEEVEKYSNKSEDTVLISDNQNDALSKILSKKTIIYTLLTTIVFVCVVFIGYKIFWFDKSIKKTEQMLKNEETINQSEDSIKTSTRTIQRLATSSAQARVLVLKNKPDEPILDLDEAGGNNGCFDIAFWNDNVVTMNTGNLMITNLKNGEKRNIPVTSYMENDYVCYFGSYELNVISNKLFISVNPHKTEGGLFVLNKSNDATPSAIKTADKIVTDMDNNSVVRCWFGQSGPGFKGQGYCVLDPKTLALVPITHSEASTYIGKDNNRLLFAGTRATNARGDLIASYILAVPNNKWDLYEGVIAEKDFPKDFWPDNIRYVSSDNSIIFFGDNIKQIKLDSGETKTLSYPDNYHPNLYSRPDIELVKDSILCVDFKEMVEPRTYAYQTTTGSLVDYKQNCPAKTNDYVEKNRYKIPSQYDIKTTEVIRSIPETRTIPINDPLPTGWSEKQ